MLCRSILTSGGGQKRHRPLMGQNLCPPQGMEPVPTSRLHLFPAGNHPLRKGPFRHRPSRMRHGSVRLTSWWRSSKQSITRPRPSSPTVIGRGSFAISGKTGNLRRFLQKMLRNSSHDGKGKKDRAVPLPQ